MVKWERMDKQVYWTQNTLENLKKKKNRRMRILGACIFSKSFGGKIHHIWTDVTYRMNKKNFLKSPLNSFFFLQVHGTLKLQVLDFGKRILTLIHGSLKEMCYSPICTSAGILFQMAF